MTGPPVHCNGMTTLDSMRSKTQSADSPDEEMGDTTEQMDQDELSEDAVEQEEPLTDYDVVEEPTLPQITSTVFIPYCKRSTNCNAEFGEFGLFLQQLPSNVTSILLEYEVFCPEAGYSLCVPPQKWMSAGENVAFTSFKTSKVGTAPFRYNAALKIMKV